MISCLICNSNKAKPVFTEQGIDILHCSTCGHVYSSFEQKEGSSGYFNEDIEKADHFWWREAHGQMYEDFKNRYMSGGGGRLLDVGCGLGYFINQVSARKNWEIHGTEISEPAVKFAQKKLGLKNIFLGKTENAGYSDGFFDIITMWDVIEHIPDPRPLLKYLRIILKEDGLLFMHTPNINIQLPKAKFKKMFFGERGSVHYLEARDHINIYSPVTIKKLLTSCGFSDTRLTHLHPIQSVAGSSSMFLQTVKNVWYYSSLALDKVSGSRINLDNLFVVARK